MAVGLARTDAIFYSAATGVGNPVVYLGSKTGRDGIHGASMASAEFDDASESKRPTVQVGDPFAEKLLLEACLELMATGAVIAIQDMGAAGLTCSAVEMGDKGDLGIRARSSTRCRCAKTNMTAYEMMLSRKPGADADGASSPENGGRGQGDLRQMGSRFRHCRARRSRKTLRFVVIHGGETKADLPLKALSVTNAPEYDRPHGWRRPHQPVTARCRGARADRPDAEGPARS